MRSSTLALVAVFVLGGSTTGTTGCKKKSKEQGPPSGGSRAVRPSPAPPKRGADGRQRQDQPLKGRRPVKVSLKQGGSGQKRLLRYHWRQGWAQTLKMEMRMYMGISMGGSQRPILKLPLMKFSAPVKTLSVNDKGELKYSFTYRRIELDSAGLSFPADALAKMTQAIRQIEGLKGWARVDNRGKVIEANLTLPAGLDKNLQQLMSNMKQQIEQLTVPLPAEPVGVGSSWQAVRYDTSGGFAVRNTFLYRLKALQGDKATLAVSITQDAEPQDMKLPGLPPASKVRLNRYQNQGSGTTVIDLNHPLPVGTMSSAGETEMTINAGGQKRAMTLIMKLQFVVHPGDVAAPPHTPLPGAAPAVSP